MSYSSRATRFKSEQEELASYDAQWRNLTKQFFKLETHQAYADEYSPGYRDFVDGKISLAELRELLRTFLCEADDLPYEEMKRRRLKYIRVHVVVLPLSSYLRYELESYRLSAEMGETIYLVTSQVAETLAKSVSLQDCLIFDDEAVHVQYYDDTTGLWDHTDLLEDPFQVAEYVKLREGLLQVVTPLAEFLQSDAIE